MMPIPFTFARASGSAGPASPTVPSSLLNRPPPQSWEDLSERRPLPVRFVLLPSRRTGGSTTGARPSAEAAGSSARQQQSREQLLTPAWACFVPSPPISASTSADKNGGVTIYRLLDPEFREPFVSFGALCQAAGLTVTEGLIRFASLLRRPSGSFSTTQGGGDCSDNAPSPARIAAGAPLLDLSLAGLEPCTELWVPLTVARAAAAACGGGLLERLALLLGWNTRHAWSLDEGEAGIIHNWRLDAALLPPATYSLASLLSTSIHGPAPIQILTRGTQVRTLISADERTAIVERWRAGPNRASTEFDTGPEDAGTASQAPPLPHAMAVGDPRMRLPDDNAQMLMRWSLDALDELDEMHERALGRGPASQSMQQGRIEPFAIADTQQTAPALAGSLIRGRSSLRLGLSTASVLLLLRDFAARTSVEAQSASRDAYTPALQLCDGAITLDEREMALFSTDLFSSLDSGPSSPVTRGGAGDRPSQLDIIKAKAKVFLVHYLSILGISQGPVIVHSEQHTPALPPRSSHRHESVPSPTTPALVSVEKRLDRLEGAVGRMEAMLDRAVSHMSGQPAASGGPQPLSSPSPDPSDVDPEQRREVRSVHFEPGAAAGRQPSKQSGRIEPSTAVPPKQASEAEPVPSPSHGPGPVQGQGESKHAELEAMQEHDAGLSAFDPARVSALTIDSLVSSPQLTSGFVIVLLAFLAYHIF